AAERIAGADIGLAARVRALDLWGRADPARAGQAAILRGEALRAAGDLTGAATALEAAVRSAPSDLAFLDLAHAQLALGRRGEAAAASGLDMPASADPSGRPAPRPGAALRRLEAAGFRLGGGDAAGAGPLVAAVRDDLPAAPSVAGLLLRIARQAGDASRRAA